MLELLGRQFRCCDGLTRRDAHRVGALGLGGLTLPQLLALRAQAADGVNPAGHKSVIFLELAGGPTHFETYDPKPRAPIEYRGPLGTVGTNVAGVQLSQLMHRQAQVMDKLAIIRSIHHDSSSHGTSSHLTQTGYYLRDRRNRDNDMPCAGSVAARVRGPNQVGVPPYVALLRKMRYGDAAYLGQAYNPFEVRQNPNRDNFRVDNLDLARGLTLEDLESRSSLLGKLDQARRVRDTKGVAQSMNKFTHKAFDMVTSGKALEAFQIGKEPDQLRDRYGRTSTGQALLLARRLVEAGVTFVTVRSGGWDDHNQIEKRMKDKGPEYDQAVAGLIRDLHERGLDRDVLFVSMGEFGRTPKVNGNAGRDHWGNVMSVLLAGGGLRMGQVVGSSNDKGEVPQDQPYRPENVLAMVYRHLGIDPKMTFPDFSGRPRYVLEDRHLIEELI